MRLHEGGLFTCAHTLPDHVVLVAEDLGEGSVRSRVAPRAGEGHAFQEGAQEGVAGARVRREEGYSGEWAGGSWRVQRGEQAEFLGMGVGGEGEEGRVSPFKDGEGAGVEVQREGTSTEGQTAGV